MNLRLTKFSQRKTVIAACLGGLLVAACVAAAAMPQQAAGGGRSFRAVNYEVEAALLPAERKLAARARVDFEAREIGGKVEFELHPNLKVTNVIAADGAALNFERDAAAPMVVRVTLKEMATAGQKVTLFVTYEGQLSGAENSPVAGVPLARVANDESYLLQPARWFPLTEATGGRYTYVFHIIVPDTMAVVGTGTPVAPEMRTAGSTLVTAPGRAAQATAQTLSTPPAKKGKAPAKAAEAVPAAAAASGTRVEPLPFPGPQTVYTFRSERAEAGGTFLAGNIQAVMVQAEGLKVGVYVPAFAANTAAAYGEATGKIVNYFSDQFGPLAQPNLNVGQLPDGTLPGYAAPGLLLVARRQWDPKVNYRLLAQLAARQWWGAEVAPATANDLWLSDGLARYCEALYVQHLAGPEGFNRALEDFAVGALIAEDAAPIIQSGRLEMNSTEYRSVLVNKGALVFNMLRALIGDEAFGAVLRDFYAKYRGKSARVADFEVLAQEQAQKPSGGRAPMNLAAFFAQWLHSTGIPAFQLEYIVYRTPKGFRIVGKVKQDLETFRMPMEVKVETEGNPEYKEIEVIGVESTFVIETFGRPKAGGITLDPNNHLLKASPQLRVRSFIARGEEFAEQGKYLEAIEVYQQALGLQKNNSLAHFRMGEAFFFQKNFQASANAFRDAIEGDLALNYKWVEVWSHIYLGKIFDLSGQRDRAVNEYSKAKDLNDDTGGAQAEIEALLKTPYAGEQKAEVKASTK